MIFDFDLKVKMKRAKYLYGFASRIVRFKKFFNPLDENELESSVKLLLENPNICNKMALEGAKFAQKFNDKYIAKSYFDIYNNLC